MILSNIIVVLFLQIAVQVGLVEGVDFRGRLRAEFANSAESKGALDAWIESAMANRSKPLSFCVIESGASSEDILSDHLRKRLIAREENGHVDIMSTPENVARHSEKVTAQNINFIHAAGYCWMTITNLSKQ